MMREEMSSLRCSIGNSLKVCALYECRHLVLNGNEIKSYTPTMKCIGEIDTFSNTGPHKVFYVLCKFQYGHHKWHDTQ